MGSKLIPHKHILKLSKADDHLVVSFFYALSESKYFKINTYIKGGSLILIENQDGDGSIVQNHPQAKLEAATH